MKKYLHAVQLIAVYLVHMELVLDNRVHATMDGRVNAVMKVRTVHKLRHAQLANNYDCACMHAYITRLQQYAFHRARMEVHVSYLERASAP